MLARAVLAVSTVLLTLTGLLPAQIPPWVEPRTSRPLAPRNWTPAGAHRIAGITIQRDTTQDAGTDFVGLSIQQTPTSSHSLMAFDYSQATNTLTARPDFAAINLDAQELAITTDLLTLAVNVTGVGPRVLQRASVAAAWGSPTPIQGLPGSEYGLQFCTRNGVLCLMTCTLPPNSHIVVYPFDATTISVGSAVATMYPPLGNPNNFLAFATPLEDDVGETRGFLACVRQPVGFAQQFVFTGGTDGTAVWRVFLNTPLNTFFVGGDQLRGGHVVAANSGLPIGALPIGAVDVIGTFTFRTVASTLGGPVELLAMGPVGDIGAIGIAAGVVPPVQVPGFSNLLGLDPTLIVVIFAQLMPDGVARVPVLLPPTVAAAYALQSVSLGPPGTANHFGNTEWLHVQ